MIRDKISSILKQKAIEPQLRTELHHLSVQLDSPDAQLIEVQFNNRFYDEPTIIQGNGSVSYQTADGKKYRVGLLMTVQEYLMDKESKLIVGAKIFVRARQLPKKLEYPIYGQQDIVVIGKATTKYLGALSDAIPYIPQNGTQDDNDEEFENDPPPAITGLTLTTGVYYPSDSGKGQTPFAFIKANWDAVIHNDLQGYESDISENDNTHYDDKPDPKFNSSTMMAWTGLKLNTTYYVRVRAVDLAGNYSDWVEASITTPVNDEISAPTTLTADSQPPRGIVLHWIASSSANVFSYEIYRSTTDDISSATKIGESQSTVYFDNNLNAGTTYYYWVRAVSTSGRYSDFVGPVDAIPYKLTDTDVQANSLYNALADGSVSKEKIQAGAITADKIATGALLTYNGTFVNRLKKNAIKFSVVSNSDYNNCVVNFESGTVDLVTYDETNGWGTITVNTNSHQTTMGTSQDVYKYVYILVNTDDNGNPQSGTYSLMDSSVYPTDSNAVVLFFLYGYRSEKTKQYTFDVQKLGSMGTIINGDHIQTGSLTADHLKVGTITSNSECIGSLNATKITAGTLDANLITITHLSADSVAESKNRKWAAESGATVGAQAGVNLRNYYGSILYDSDIITSQGTAKDIQNLKSSPSGTGFFNNGIYMGFYSNNYWRTYINNDGYFVMKDSSNNLVLQSGYFQDTTIASQNGAQHQFNIYDGSGHCTFHASGTEVSIYPKSDAGTILILYGKTSNQFYQAFTGLSMNTVKFFSAEKWGLQFISSGDKSYYGGYEFGGYVFDYPVFQKFYDDEQNKYIYLPHIFSGNIICPEMIEHGTGYIDSGSYSTTVYFNTKFSTTPDVVVTGYGSGETANFHIGEITTDYFTVGVPDANGHSFRWIAIGGKT